MCDKEQRIKERARKRNRLVEVTIFILAAVLTAQICSGVMDSNQNPTGYELKRRDKLYGVHFTDQKTGFAFGNKGLLLKTTDGGANWTKINVREPRIESFNGIDFAGNIGWLVGGNGLIFCTEDSGETWQEQQSGVQDALMAVKFLNPKQGVVVGAGGVILVTDDAGRSWKTDDLDWLSVLPESVIQMGVTTPNLYDCSF